MSGSSYTSLALKGVGGNVTPVALASLATIVPRKKFTLCLAIAICAYSLGWVAIYLRSFEHLPLSTAILALLSLLAVIRGFRESEFDNFRFQNNTASLGKFFTFLRKDIIAIAIFAIGVSVMLAFLGFIASEISFYQILLRGEVVHSNGFYTGLSWKFGCSYYLGTFFLYLLKKNNITDIRCIGIGIITAVLAITIGAITLFSGFVQDKKF